MAKSKQLLGLYRVPYFVPRGIFSLPRTVNITLRRPEKNGLRRLVSATYFGQRGPVTFGNYRVADKHAYLAYALRHVRGVMA